MDNWDDDMRKQQARAESTAAAPDSGAAGTGGAGAGDKAAPDMYGWSYGEQTGKTQDTAERQYAAAGAEQQSAADTAKQAAQPGRNAQYGQPGADADHAQYGQPGASAGHAQYGQPGADADHAQYRDPRYNYTAQQSTGTGSGAQPRGWTNDWANGTYAAPRQEAPAPAPKAKKERRYVSRAGFIIGLIVCMLVTSGATIGGLKLAGAFDRTVGTSGQKTINATNYTLAKATGNEKTIEEIIAQNENAVVEIQTEAVTTDSWMRNFIRGGAGSGVIIDSRGYILTCKHVIQNANAITVRLKDSTEYKATVVGYDDLTDIAILKIDGSGFTAAVYGDSDNLSVGDLVVAIGNPLGSLGGTATTGIISSLNRELTVEGKVMNLMQTDASINPGNSGGGLFDGEGNLVGIVVAKSTGSDVEGLGFAIPISQVAEIAKQLIENGRVEGRAQIGISIIDLTDPSAAAQYGLSTPGIYITEVTSSGAQEAGFEQGDMIMAIDDTAITDEAMLRSCLAGHKPGDEVTITVVRDGKTVQIKTKLTEAQ